MILSVSAIRSPNDVIPAAGAIAEQQNPLIVFNVGGSAPGRIVSEDLDVPSA
jgi:hypothetical protein